MQPNLAVLRNMLRYARPAGSFTERQFVTTYLASLPGAFQDAYGNFHVRIGNEAQPILWSIHTDTVHHAEGYQTLTERDGLIALSKRSARAMSCLGADDTAGVFLAHQMIVADVPGYYLFHWGEEIGGIGSSNLAADELWSHHLAECACAIALDRRGTSDVITHQYGRCCSDAFALSLATALNAHGLTYAPSPHGIFTDTANYTDMIGECTNLSIGYAGAHSAKETLDLAHVTALYTALCTLRADQLTYAREPGEFGHESGAIVLNWPEDPSTSPAFDLGDATAYRGGLWSSCRVCELAYSPTLSTADDSWEYCSRDCEDWDAMRSIYLTTEQAAVQAALRRRRS